MTWMRTLFSQLKSYISRSFSETCRWLRSGGTFWIWLALTVAVLVTFHEVPGKLPDRVRWEL